MEEPVEYNAGKKEEYRIWIEFNIPKPKGAIEATKCITMTRSEAINRMAKALEEAYLNRNKDYIFHFGLLAEAALDALLCK